MRREYTVDGGTLVRHPNGSPMSAYDVAAKLNELTEELVRYKGMLETAQRNRDFMQRQRDVARRELDELKQTSTKERGPRSDSKAKAVIQARGQSVTIQGSQEYITSILGLLGVLDREAGTAGE